MSDVIIVGGGIIGLSIALELAEHGAEVRVFDKQKPAREASWAGAGMIPPGNFQVETTGIAGLRALSASLWPQWSRKLREETRVDNGFHVCGAIEIAAGNRETTPEQLVSHYKLAGQETSLLTSADLRQQEPALDDSIAAGCHLPGLAQMRPPRHGRALVASCQKAGVALHADEEVLNIISDSRRATEVQTEQGTYSAKNICIAAGAWTKRLLNPLGTALNVIPVRGQMVLLNTSPKPIDRVILQGSRYLVPRPDGRVLVGSTEEHVGFQKENTARVISELIEFARGIVPALASANVEKTWAGLRPGSPAGIPFLGRLPNYENVFVAAGHFRDGLLLSTGTSVVMRQLLMGEKPALDLSPFAVPAC